MISLIPSFLTSDGSSNGLFLSALVKIVKSFMSTFHHIGIVMFGYVLPALSSVKAVVHRDVDAYHQWTTHFLILHLYTLVLQPLLSFTIHPSLQLAFVLWLSLPRTQGALCIYNKILVPLLDRYETKVDDRITEVKGELWRMALSTLMSTGFGAAHQLGLLLRLAWSGAPAPSADTNEGGGGYVEVQGRPTIENEGARKRDPQHSVQESLLLIRNSDDDDSNNKSNFNKVEEANLEETETYVRDFMGMLQRGLFVFARTTEKGKKLKLRVFSYEEDIQSFLISSVDTDALEEGVAVSLSDVDSVVASGPQGIIFRMLDGTILAEIVLSDAQDRDTLLEGLDVSLSLMQKNSDDESEVDNEGTVEESGSFCANSMDESDDESASSSEAILHAYDEAGDKAITNGAGKACCVTTSLLAKSNEGDSCTDNLGNCITLQEDEKITDLQTATSLNTDTTDDWDEADKALHNLCENKDNSKLDNDGAIRDSEFLSANSVDGLDDRSAIMPSAILSANGKDDDIVIIDDKKSCDAMSSVSAKSNVENLCADCAGDDIVPQEAEKITGLQTAPSLDNDAADDWGKVDEISHHSCESDVQDLEPNDAITIDSDTSIDCEDNLDNIPLTSSQAIEVSETQQSNDNGTNISCNDDKNIVFDKDGFREEQKDESQSSI